MHVSNLAIILLYMASILNWK